MDEYHSFYVERSTQTYSDTLVAFGLARHVSELLDRQGEDEQSVQIINRGGYFELKCEPALRRITLEEVADAPLCPIKAIITDQYRDVILEKRVPAIDWKEVDEFFAFRKGGLDAENAPPRPANLDLLQAINPPAIQGYSNLVIGWWSIRHIQPQILEIMLDLYGEYPNITALAEKRWAKLIKANNLGLKTRITGQQIYNPDQGEGQNKTKADGLIPRKKPEINFWLTEWLRAVGFYEAAVTKLVGDANASKSKKDRVIYVVLPRQLDFESHRSVIDKFSQTIRPSSPTIFGILTTIRYLKTLLEYLMEPEQTFHFASIGQIQETLVSGFQTAYFQTLGKGKAVTNISFTSLPGWVVIRSIDDVQQYRFVFDELDRLVMQFDRVHKSRSAGVFDYSTLLRHLRDFLSSDELEALFRFTALYPSYLMKAGRSKNLVKVKTWLIERIIMSSEDVNFMEIVQSQGFRNIAYALRKSTIGALYWTQEAKKSKQSYPYQIRYGLAQDFTRVAPHQLKFISALCEFVSNYNNETAMVADDMRKRNIPMPFRHQRKMIQEADLDEVVELIYRCGSDPVAKLLVAYGYASSGRSEDYQDEVQDEYDEEE